MVSHCCFKLLMMLNPCYRSFWYLSWSICPSLLPIFWFLFFSLQFWRKPWYSLNVSPLSDVLLKLFSPSSQFIYHFYFGGFFGKHFVNFNRTYFMSFPFIIHAFCPKNFCLPQIHKEKFFVSSSRHFIVITCIDTSIIRLKLVCIYGVR